MKRVGRQTDRQVSLNAPRPVIICHEETMEAAQKAEELGGQNNGRTELQRVPIEQGDAGERASARNVPMR